MVCSAVSTSVCLFLTLVSVLPPPNNKQMSNILHQSADLIREARTSAPRERTVRDQCDQTDNNAKSFTFNSMSTSLGFGKVARPTAYKCDM